MYEDMDKTANKLFIVTLAILMALPFFAEDPMAVRGLAVLGLISLLGGFGITLFKAFMSYEDGKDV